jgi:hypothetical protein
MLAFILTIRQDFALAVRLAAPVRNGFLSPHLPEIPYHYKGLVMGVTK